MLMRLVVRDSIYPSRITSSAVKKIEMKMGIKFLNHIQFAKKAMFREESDIYDFHDSNDKLLFQWGSQCRSCPNTFCWIPVAYLLFKLFDRIYIQII